jgi:tetratricopeptide (TPR) repeat protein
VIAKASTAIETDPTNADAYYLRGQAFSYKPEFANAIDDFDEAIRLDSMFNRAYRRRAWIFATCP